MHGRRPPEKNDIVLSGTTTRDSFTSLPPPPPPGHDACRVRFGRGDFVNHDASAGVLACARALTLGSPHVRRQVQRHCPPAAPPAMELFEEEWAGVRLKVGKGVTSAPPPPPAPPGTLLG